MQKLFILPFFVLTLYSCDKGKKVVQSEDAQTEVLDDFQPTEQGQDYIAEETVKSYIPNIDDEAEEKRSIKDGSYIADVEYFNISTGANVTYVTKVMVRDGYLEVIKWPNGVWLASNYFKPHKIRQDGTCIIKNIEAGYENRVKILNLEYN